MKNAELKVEMENQDSIFHFFQKLIALRKQSETMVYGEFKPVFTRDKNTLCYFRIGSGEKYYIEINLTNQDQKRPGPITGGHVLVAGNYVFKSPDPVETIRQLKAL